MRSYPNQQLNKIVQENVRILSRYCLLLEAEGYWEHPQTILRRPILEFLTVYVQGLMVHLAGYMKREEPEVLELIAHATTSNLLNVTVEGVSEETAKQAEQLAMAPPILLQLCSLRDVEKHSSLTGLFFDGLLNILLSEAAVNDRKEAAVTTYIKEYYSRIRVFIRSANSHGACVDEKYIFHKICMGELVENTNQLGAAGDDFSSYKENALFLKERKSPVHTRRETPEQEQGSGKLHESKQEIIKPSEPEPERKRTVDEKKEDGIAPEAKSEAVEIQPEEDAALQAVTNWRLDKLMQELNDLVGLTNVKEEIHSLINLIRVRKLRERYQLPDMPMSYHMVFTGNPGTGKTTIARLIGEIYRELGIVSKGNLVETDRAGLVAGYVGQTALKVKEVVERARGGILFIDEAYSLSNPLSPNDFGGEVIDTLVKLMEDYRDDFVVIVAGYTAEMKQFLEANTGLISRFNKFLEFPDYSEEELLLIIQRLADKSGFTLMPETAQAISEYLSGMNEEQKKRFGNARGVRNLFEKLVAAQANRVVSLAAPTKEELSELTKEDWQQMK